MSVQNEWEPLTMPGYACEHPYCDEPASYGAIGEEGLIISDTRLYYLCEPCYEQHYAPISYGPDPFLPLELVVEF